MSAIAGLVSLIGAPIERTRLERMAEAAAALGPDGQRVWSSGPCGLAHLKLTVTPESVDEIQPLVDTEAQIALVFDGRLDNRAEILRELNGRGDGLKDAGDSHLVLAMYKLYGRNCPERLTGDYALAIWESRDRLLFCARSLLGWRPFLWWTDEATFAFATEIKQLFAAGGIDRAINEGMVGEVLAHSMTHAEETLWKGVYRLPPGYAMTVSQGRTRTWRWHQPPFQEDSPQTEGAYVERFRELFDQSIKSCVRSITPVTSQLSGGLDSSSIVCRAAQLHKKGEIALPVQPISAVFPGRRHDESEWIDMVASKAGITPKRFEPSPYDWSRAIAWTRDTLNLPLRPNAHLMDSTAAQVPGYGSRVLLTGEGGDDWLNGSHSHWADLLHRLKFIQLLREGFGPDGNRSAWSKARRLAGNSVGPWVSTRLRDFAIYSARPGSDLAPWIRPEWAKQIGLAERLRRFNVTPGLDGIAQQQRYQRYLGIRHHVTYDGVLSSMARKGIEVRHPFHDRRLTEFILCLPGNLLRRGAQRKYILRQAMAGVLPEPIRTRMTKATFVTTFVDSIEEYLAARPLHQWSAVSRGWVNADALVVALNENKALQQGGSLSANQAPTPLGPLWFALALDIWMTHAFKP